MVPTEGRNLEDRRERHDAQGDGREGTRGCWVRQAVGRVGRCLVVWVSSGTDFRAWGGWAVV